MPTSGWKKLKDGEVSVEKMKAYYGGKWPDCNGRKYKYPGPKADKAWAKLITSALNYQRKIVYYKRNNMMERAKKERNYKYEYVLYHCRPEQKARRGIRNKHRAEAEKKHGSLKGKHVHHTNPVTMGIKSTVVLTEKQHRDLHAKEVNELNKKMKKLGLKR